MSQGNALLNAFRRAHAALVNDKVFRRVIINSGWLLSSNTIASGLMLVQGIIITRSLGVSQFGTLALITTYVMTINQLVDSRVWEAVIKFIPQYRERGENNKAIAVLKLFYFIDAIGSVVTITVVALSASFVAEAFFKDTSVADLIKLYSLYVVIDFSTETSSALLRLHNRFKWLSYHSVITAIIRLVGAIVLWASGAGIAIMLMIILVTSAISVVLMQVMAFRALKEMGLARWNSAPISSLRGDFRSIFSFLTYSNLAGTSRLITSRVDILLLGWFSTPEQIGLYELAKRLVNQILTLLSPIYTAVYPEISKLVAQNERGKVHLLQRKLVRSILALIIPACLIFTVACIWVIPGIFGEEFTASIPLAQIMVWTLLWTPLIWFPGFLLALGKSRTQAALTWADAVIYLILLLLLIPGAGGLGAAVATLLRFLIWILLVSRIFLHINRVGWNPNLQAT